MLLYIMTLKLMTKEFRKLNNSVNELFIFKILLIANDWNF